jgi:hypothetical protein
MPQRIPHAGSPTEVRQAFQRSEERANVLLTGASGYILVGQGVGVAPVWGTEATSLTKLIVDNITINAATIVSDTGAISFGDENLTTTGTITGVNVTSGADPGHSHTGASLGTIDISDDTNLAVTSPITLTDDTVGLNQLSVDHGSIGGLGDDDHTQYILVDGTRAFSGTVSGVLPTDSSHLVTKEYVDQVVQFETDFFFNDTISDVGGIYYKMQEASTGEVKSTFSVGPLGAGNDQPIVNFITDAGVPGTLALDRGIYLAHVHAQVTAGNKPVKFYFKLYYRKVDTSEYLIGTSEVSDYVTTDELEYDLDFVILSDVVIEATDRIVIKFFANVEATGTDVTLALYAEGATVSRAELPTTTEILNALYLRQDGTKNLTGNLTVSAGVTIDGRDLSVDGAKLDGIEALADVTDATNVAAAGAAMAGGAYHDGFSDFVANEHVDHTGVTLTAGSGIAGGGTIAANRSFDLDINSLSVATIVSGDFIPFWDITATATNKKTTFTNFEAALTHANLIGGHNITTDIDHATITNTHNLTTDIDHDQTTNYDANKHVDHTGVSIATAATSGISGGGTIAATRNLALNINGLTGESAIVAADTIPFYDATAGANRKVTLSELSTALGVADEKVKIDSGATAGYIGAASSDGVLRTSTGLGYTDGGDFITLALSHLGIESLTDPGADRILFWDDGGTATGWLTVGTGLDLTTTNLTLSHLGIENLSDAGADKILFWDDGGTATGWLAVTGTGQGIITTNLEINAGYVDRGDPSAYDFALADFTFDSTWNDLDLSGIVPSGAYAVDISATITSTNAGYTMYFRKNANTNYHNSLNQQLPVAAMSLTMNGIVPYDSVNEKIQYFAANAAGWTKCNFVVKGWYI